MSSILVVHNAKSGNSDALKDIRRAFAAHELSVDYIDIASRSFTAQARKHLRAHGTFVAAGGDGTINAVAELVHNTTCTLGIIPVGTLNHFAKQLDIPLDAKEAVAVIVRGQVTKVDIGSVNDRIFVNNSSIGLYPRAVITRDSYKSSFGKWPAAGIGVVRALLRPHRYHVQLRIDGREETLRTPFVFIGNNEYQRDQLGIGDRETLNGGVLSVYVVKSAGLAHLPRLLRALMSRRRRTRDLAIYRSESCTISMHTRRAVAVACDGEVFRLKAPLHYQSKPRSLRVLIPHHK